MTRGPRLGYRPSLDGLRALAVLAVLMAHFEVRLGSGGMVGVDVFFVLSGFLITTLLLQEQDDTGRIHFGGFYRRRAARLLPALTVMLAATAVVVSLTGVERRRTLEAAAPVLFYFGNWWRVAGHDLGPLGHTWSLAVEEQFYLIWPVLLLLTRRWWQATVGLAVVGVGVALAVRVVACSDGRCVIRTYHSTDTRMDGLLIGVMVAVAFHRDWLLRLPPRLTGAAGWGALAALAVIAISPLHWDSYWYDTGGMTATALLSAVVLVGVLVHERHERTMLVLAAYAGLRVSEIGRVRGEDLDRTAGTLYVLGKGGKQSIIPTHRLLLEQAEHYAPRGYWFGRGKEMCRSAVWRNMHRGLVRVGSSAAPHQVRHFYGTSLLDSGARSASRTWV